MNAIELSSGIFHLQGGSNMGLIVQDGKALLIDTGLDGDTARRALRLIEAMGANLEAVFLTHAHADHFGGAAFLQQRASVPLHAPALEAAMMENPIIEPLYLFAGAAPIEELRQKFTLAPPCRIDRVVTVEEPRDRPQSAQIGPFEVALVPLPGHAPNQLGVAVGPVVFCADALFPNGTLKKHKVTFCTDLDESLETLERLPGLEYAHFAPGHGPAYTAGAEIEDICAANQDRLREIRGLVLAALEAPQETAALVQHVADHLGLKIGNPTGFFLTRTTILAALRSLERAGEATAAVHENRLLWRRVR
jgi:glyoxylase-like metal-dependent hydrolase (beta-lactamase superfamily II)